MEVTKGKIGAAQKKVDKLTKEIDVISDNIVKSRTMIKKVQKYGIIL